MSQTFIFRDFSYQDAEAMYLYKNDAKLNAMIVGAYHPMTIEEVNKWIEGCIHTNRRYKFWAIAPQDQPQHLIGWTSISEIEEENRSARMHSMVIGDPIYRDGFAWIQSYLFVMDYVFNQMQFHRLWGIKRADHIQSVTINQALFWKEEGLLRQAKLDTDRYVDISIYGILRDEYLMHMQNGEYEMRNIRKRIASFFRQRIQQGKN